MKRYAIVGLGSRANMYVEALLGTFRDETVLAGLCDLNQTRMDYYNRRISAAYGAAIPTYKPADFERMLDEQRIDTVIVTSVDRTHHLYITRAMLAGRDVISEKPMTVDAEKCQAILDTQRATGRKLTVTFNYRYAPHHTQIKEILRSGAIGRVLSVHFEWLLDTRHGADYFRRWHRDKRNSGGLMVHKATHHFDLVNWWLDAAPDAVFGFGQLAFYGRANAEARGETRFYARAHGNPLAAEDPWAIHLEDDEDWRQLYLDAEHEDGYLRDQSVFGDNISIEDDMALVVRYNTGATMSYHLTAYSPWEGYRVMFNGDRGRLEIETVEASYVSGAREGGRSELPREPRITIRPHWSQAREIPAETGSGDHGGGDERLLADLFGPPVHDPLGRAAGPRDGALSILTGIAANRAFASGLPVQIGELVRWPVE